MPLEEYHARRKFEFTPEPAGAKPRRRGKERPLQFVVQEHDATRLHYDLRLELDGVLKSWAVTRGPSLDPAQRRLAVMTEDHPMDYANFEGVIPPGNYGAGRVIVWDHGAFHTLGAESRAESEAELRRMLEKGDIKLVFEGEKLRGAFSLVRTRDDSWLLIKKKDDFVSSEDILLQDRSVISGKRLDDLAPPRPKRPRRGRKAEIASDFLANVALGEAVRANMPSEVRPMLACLTDEAFDREGWIYELKWDGFRAIAETHRGGPPRLYSRNLTDYAVEFAPILPDLQSLPFEAVLDGEIVVVDDNGRSDFKLLQNYRKTGQGRLVYYVFDILYLEGYSLLRLPLLRRKEVLRKALQAAPGLPYIKYSDHVAEHGVAFFQLALKNDLEGVIAKNGASLYRLGDRSEDWLKVKTHHRQDAVIGGYTAPRGSRKNLGALLLGVYENGELIYVGHTGGGMDDVELGDLRARLEKRKRRTSPFTITPKANAEPTWVEPELVCEVKFAGWTEDGCMRQPIFLGMRPDKEPRQVRHESPVSPNKPAKRTFAARKRGAPDVLMIEGQRLEVTNLSKVYWPEEALTKGDLIDYYRRISPYILPYLKDRPMSLHRFPNGIEGKHFFQKDLIEAGGRGGLPAWVQTLRVEDDDADPVDYLLVNDQAALVFAANLGSIELHPWNSRLGSLEQPDYMVMDLDPDDNTFNDVIRTAHVVKEYLDLAGVPSYPKTSGQTGLHIYVPLGAKYTYEQARQFVQLIGQLVNRRLPELTSLERSPSKRKGQIYLDYLQNRQGATLAAPYSLRPKPGAPVSTPLQWDEVVPGLSPAQFTIKTIFPRLEKLGDIFQPILDKGIDMPGALRRLQAKLTKG
jgi:bifunctional non-homologous end joining protein LigD